MVNANFPKNNEKYFKHTEKLHLCLRSLRRKFVNCPCFAFATHAKINYEESERLKIEQ
jgi:hypothetical protein